MESVSVPDANGESSSHGWLDSCRELIRQRVEVAAPTQFMEWVVSWCLPRFNWAVLFVNVVRTLLVFLIVHELRKGHLIFALMLVVCLCVALVFEPTDQQRVLQEKLESTVCEFGARCQGFQEEFRALQGTFSETADELNKRNKQLDETNSKLATTSTALEYERKMVAMTVAQLETVQNTLRETADEYQELQSQLRSYSEEARVALRQEVRELQAERGELEQRIRALEPVRARLSESVERLERSVRLLEEKLKEL